MFNGRKCLFFLWEYILKSSTQILFITLHHKQSVLINTFFSPSQYHKLTHPSGFLLLQVPLPRVLFGLLTHISPSIRLGLTLYHFPDGSLAMPTLTLLHLIISVLLNMLCRIWRYSISLQFSFECFQAELIRLTFSNIPDLWYSTNLSWLQSSKGKW